VLNAADEIAVQAFLENRIAFTDIPRLIENTLNAHSGDSKVTFESVMAADAWARRHVWTMVPHVKMAKS
jgi:1-deoxy-D-xylulose-5-phosphate reductoisomerase